MKEKTEKFLSTLMLICVLALAFGANDVFYPSTGLGLDLASSSGGHWSLDRITQWSATHAVDNSVELVIGVKNSRSDTYSELTRIAAENGGNIVDKVANKETTVAYVVKTPVDEVSSFATAIEANGFSRYIEPNIIGELQSVPNDPYWGQQWGPKKIEADWAWNTTVGDDSILVAILDSGMNFTHPDLISSYLPFGHNWVNNNNDLMDVQGHGTNVAGIIAAEMNNEMGIAGMARVKIMMERITNPLTLDNAVKGIYHAVDEGAKIINMSWGFYEDTSLLHDAIQYAYDAGALLIAAAGNEVPYPTPQEPYPAGYEEVIGVSATGENDRFVTDKKGWNYGSWVELAAPGVNITTTTMKGAYALQFGGTSFATACVSGVAALVWSRFPYMTRDQVRVQLRYTADHPAGMGTPGIDIHYGYGRINAKRAVNETEIPTIQTMISLMEKSGGSITIRSGIHNENIVVDKPVSLIGQTWNSTVIDGGGPSFVFTMTNQVRNVKISSLTIRNFNSAAVVLNGSDNTICANNIINSGQGICTWSTTNNTIYHNNFINNTRQAFSINSSNRWDNGYPSGGNYWSDYNGTDEHMGPNQDIPGSDGIGDTPYTIDEANQDRYPLMSPYQSTHSVTVRNATQNKSTIGQAFSTWVRADLTNTGDSVETFTVLIEMNATPVASETITLRSDSATRITLLANTSGLVKGTYLFSVNATNAHEEPYTLGNTYIIGSIRIAMVGDVTGGATLNTPDGKVDIKDLATLAQHYGHSTPDGHAPGTSAYVGCFNMDITGSIVGVPDNNVNIRDLALAANHYGESSP